MLEFKVLKELSPSPFRGGISGQVTYLNGKMRIASCGFTLGSKGVLELGSSWPSILIVHEHYQNRGLASKILKDTLEYAINYSIDTNVFPSFIFAQTGLKCLPARKSLENLGFEEYEIINKIKIKYYLPQEKYVL
jgi:GNAT superfamily N-acetyltransferase